MSTPNITINVCTNCKSTTCVCGQQQSSQPVQHLPAPSTPCPTTEECEFSSWAQCVFMPEDITDFNIKKGDSLLKVLNTLFQEIRNRPLP